MNISRPPLPISSQPRNNNFISPSHQDNRSRSKSRRASKQGVTLARDHSIRFDKQYQYKHMINKSGIRLQSSKKTINTKMLQQTTMHGDSTYVSHSRAYHTLDETAQIPVSNINYGTFSTTAINDDAKSMTSLDLNHPRQQQNMNQN